MMFLDAAAEHVSKSSDELWREYGELQAQVIDAWYWRTQGNISTLYRLDAFDWVILVLYFSILGVLAVYGAYRIKQVVDFWRYRQLDPQPKAQFAESDLPQITVQ